MYVWALEQASSRRGWAEGGEQDLLVPWVMSGGDALGARDGRTPATSGGSGARAGESIYRRYYHLYRKGELEEDIVAAGGSVVESGYEKDNWWALASHAE